MLSIELIPSLFYQRKFLGGLCACLHRLRVAACATATALAHAVGRLRQSFSVGAQSKVAGRPPLKFL